MLTTTETIRKKIIKDNPSVKEVGVIFDWTNSDNKFIALELKLVGGRKLFLPSVNFRKLLGREPFRISRVGDYAFATIKCFTDKRTNENKIELNTHMSYTLSELSTKIGVQLNTISDLVKYYDAINTFIESSPTVSETNYQKMIEEGELVKDTFEEIEYYFVTTYFVKTIWNDKYYGTEMKDRIECWRKPDYDNDKVVGGLFFWGI